MQRHAGPAHSATRRPGRLVAARALPVIAGISSLGGLLVAVNPRSIASAMGRFDGWTLLPVLLLLLAFYFLQGLRWHFLLRSVGAAGRASDHQLINLAGQTLTAVLPLGDLARALLASRSSGVELGATAATVTVQELTFTLLVVAAAAPGVVHMSNGLLWMLAILVGIVAIIAILTVPRLFEMARRSAAATPGLRRFVDDIETLQREVCRLLRRPDVLAGAALDLGRVICATAALLFILRGLHVNSLGWWDVALVLAASFVGGALSLLPGGIGANEASVVGVLVVLGVNPAAAAAAAIVQRMSLTLVPAAGGALAYLALRRRHTLTDRADLERAGRAKPLRTAIGVTTAIQPMCAASTL